MFDLLGRQSILSHAIENMRVETDDPDFTVAVATGREGPADIANNIFAIRPAQLLGFARRGEGAARLSGVLIGTEIAGATARFGKVDTVSVVASGQLALLYAKALESCGVRVRLVDAEAAVRRGLHAAASAFWPREGGRKT
jgi:2-dehydro-3-deoxygalactonokinase